MVIFIKKLLLLINNMWYNMFFLFGLNLLLAGCHSTNFGSPQIIKLLDSDSKTNNK